MIFRRVPLSLSFSGTCFAVRILVAVMALLFAVPVAQAASIDVRSSGGVMALVMVEGDLELTDIEAFRNKVASVGKAAVAFRSDGGSLLAGIRIGMMIRVHNFTTVVPDASQCASACAVAWLGGVHRFLGQGAKVGFHAAYVQKSGATACGTGRADVPGKKEFGLSAQISSVSGPSDALASCATRSIGSRRTAASYCRKRWMAFQEVVKAPGSSMWTFASSTLPSSIKWKRSVT